MPRILVIDHDPDMRAIMAVMLASAGHEVVVAASGLEGLEAHRRLPVDVAVIDLIMPERKGPETIQELSQKFAGVKIIAMSGGRSIDNTSNRSAASALGVGAFLLRPFDAGVLLGTIDRLLEKPL